MELRNTSGVVDSERFTIFKIYPDQLKYVVTKVLPLVRAFQGLVEEAYRQLDLAALLVTWLKQITENVCAYLAEGRKLPVLLVNHGHVGTDWNFGRVDSVLRCGISGEGNNYFLPRQQVNLSLSKPMKNRNINTILID